jgi:hypothetical protein
LSSAQTSVVADGQSTALLTATLTDTTACAVSGVSLSFSTDAGSLSAPTASTDSSGQAISRLLAPKKIGVATVTVREPTSGLSQNTTVSLVAGPAAALTLSLAPSQVSTGGKVSIGVQVTDANANPVSGAVVNFAVPTNNSGGTLAAASAVTDANGAAQTTYTAGGSIAGSVTDTIRAAIATAGVTPATASLTVTNPVKTVSLVASTPQLASNASTASAGLTLTVLVKDQNNNVVPNIPVQFSSARDSSSACGSGGTVQVVNGTTDSSGIATATLYTGGDPTNQTIDVTATAGGVAATPNPLVIQETGTHFTINGVDAVGVNSTENYTITLLDAGGNPIRDQTLSVTSSLGNSIASSSLTTDASGQVVIGYTGTNTGRDTLTVRSAGCATYVSNAAMSILVASQSLSIVAPNALSQVPFGASGTLSAGAAIAAGGSGYAVGDVMTVQGGTAGINAQITVTQVSASGAVTGIQVTNAGNYSALPSSPASVTGGNGSGARFTILQNVTVRLTGGAVAGQTISFNATRGQFAGGSTATTDAGGVANVALFQPSSAGNAGGGVITATCTTCSPQISTSVSIQFNATTPSKVTLQAQPSTVPVGGTSTISATALDANNNPVANQPVQFTLTDDSGGSLQQSSAITDSRGQAQVTYKAGNRTGSANGVSIRGAIAGSVSGTVSLTVGGFQLRIVVGTGNTITALNSTQYQLPYSVLVTDPAGNPPPVGSTVNLVTNAIAYQKGFEQFNGTVWAPVYGVTCADVTDSSGKVIRSADPGCAPTASPSSALPSTSSFGCFNEDVNLNGLLDTNEDYNTSGKLDPGNVSSVPSSAALDSNGTGQFSITYPKDRAYWVQIFLTATVQVNGDQGQTTANFVLPGLASDFNSVSVAPPGVISPYGTAITCQDPN